MPIDLTTSLSASLSAIVMLIAPALDLVLKSSIVIGLTLLAVRHIKIANNPTSRHFLWLNALICVTIMPLLGPLSSTNSQHEVSSSGFELVTVSVAAPTAEYHVENFITPAVSSGYWSTAVAIGYLLICSILLTRLTLAALQIFRIGRRAELVSDLLLVKQINEVRKELSISRTILVKFSEEISSPVSFGLTRPLVIFPAVAKNWNRDTFKSALVHELCHIGRLDWLSSTASHLTCAIFWFNPFAWQVANRLNIEAESACDLAVLNRGIDSNDYAQDLLFIARSCKHATSHQPLAQHVVSAELLKSRIAELLRHKTQLSNSFRYSRTASVLFTLPIVTILCAGSLLSAKSIDFAALNFQLDELQPVSPILEIRPARQSTTVFESDIWYDNSTKEPELVRSSELTELESRDRTGINVMNPTASASIETTPANSPLLSRAELVNELALGYVELTPENSSNLGEQVQNSQDGSPIEQIYAEVQSFSRAELSEEIARVEDEYYQTFNQNEVDSSLHVICGTYKPAGTFIDERFCEPRFIIDARSNAYSASARGYLHLRSNFSSPLALMSETAQKFEELTTAMNQALNRDARFRELHYYLSELKSLY